MAYNGDVETVYNNSIKKLIKWGFLSEHLNK